MFTICVRGMHFVQLSDLIRIIGYEGSPLILLDQLGDFYKPLAHGKLRIIFAGKEKFNYAELLTLWILTSEKDSFYKAAIQGGNAIWIPKRVLDNIMSMNDDELNEFKFNCLQKDIEVTDKAVNWTFTLPTRKFMQKVANFLKFKARKPVYELPRTNPNVTLVQVPA